jgi:Tol biopolymer transport system component
MDIDGNNQKRLIETEFPCFNPIFSPDGKRIAFTSSYLDIWEDIHIINFDGTNHVNLTSSQNISDKDPAFSPDGNMIVFRSYMDTGNNELYLYDLISNEIRRLTFSDQNNLSNYSQAKFTSSGTKIHFAGYYSITLNTLDWEIFTMNIDGSNLINLTNHYNTDANADLSKNDSIFVYTRREGQFEIGKMYLDGSGKERLTPQNYLDKLSPRISPYNDFIIYEMENPRTGKEIHRMDINGENDVNLTPGIWAENPIFTPDGNNILFEQADEIFIMDINGQNRNNLTNNASEDFGPNIQPVLP